MIDAMNSTVISGTARHSSMKAMQNVLMIGSLDCRPSASRIPIGQRQGNADDRDDQRDHQTAPLLGWHVGHEELGALGEAEARRQQSEAVQQPEEGESCDTRMSRPLRRKKLKIGKTTKNRTAFVRLNGALGQQQRNNQRRKEKEDDVGPPVLPHGIEAVDEELDLAPDIGPARGVREARQSSTVPPGNTASPMKKLKSGGMTQNRKRTPSAVSTVSPGVANRFFRIQAQVPDVRRGAGIGSTISPRT